MMRYAAAHLGVRIFIAKVALTNTPSLALFGALGFREAARATAFDEVTLRCCTDDSGRPLPSGQDDHKIL